MRRFKIALFFLCGILFSENNHPIFLLHGFIGWGRDEMNGYYYWGGKFDLESYLREQGYDVYTLSVGPVSSNRDRAVEAFHQIKGGQADYGKNHSREFGLIQKPDGRAWDGFYPEWDNEHPIHIISHSQGGQTARQLEVLLKTVYSGEDSPLLSNSHEGWIKSITTLSTPHNGTTLSPIITDHFPITVWLGTWFGVLYEGGYFEKYYDFDLDQWNLTKNESENTSQFLSRISKMPAMDSRNMAQYDLSPQGAEKFNDIYRTDSSVHYFTYVTYGTREIGKKGKHMPDWGMNARLWLPGTLLGTMEVRDSTWFRNDGIVNSISMYGPVDSRNRMEKRCDFNGISESGCWQFMKKIHMDHHKVVGHGLDDEDLGELKSLYGNHCKILKELD